MSSFCVKCKAKTGDVNPKMSITKNNRYMISSVCPVCRSHKSQFVSGSAVKPVKSIKRPLGGKKSGKGVLDWISSIF